MVDEIFDHKVQKEFSRVAVKQMHKLTIPILAVAVAIFGLVYLVGNPVTYVAVNLSAARYDSALEQLAMAESAQTPDEVIHHITNTKEQLSDNGNIAWWSVENGSFESIQADLDDIISRARNISSLELGNEPFNSEMYAIHAEIKRIQERLLTF